MTPQSGNCANLNDFMRATEEAIESHEKFAFHVVTSHRCQYADESAAHGKSVVSLYYELDRDEGVVRARIHGGGPGPNSVREIYYIGGQEFQQTAEGWTAKPLTKEATERVLAKSTAGFANLAMVAEQDMVTGREDAKRGTIVFEGTIPAEQFTAVAGNVASATGETQASGILPQEASIHFEVNAQNHLLENFRATSYATQQQDGKTLNHIEELNVEMVRLPQDYYIPIPVEIARLANEKSGIKH